jgi:hypothetical protein
MAKPEKSTKAVGESKTTRRSKAKDLAGEAGDDGAKPEGRKRGRKPNAIRRIATTLYFREDVFNAFKERLWAEKKHAYEIVEKCVEVYNALPPEVLKDLKAACEGGKRTVPEIVESALIAHLRKLKAK